jgi:hypothetical protein
MSRRYKQYTDGTGGEVTSFAYRGYFGERVGGFSDIADLIDIKCDGFHIGYANDWAEFRSTVDMLKG